MGMVRYRHANGYTRVMRWADTKLLLWWRRVWVNRPMLWVVRVVLGPGRRRRSELALCGWVAVVDVLNLLVGLVMLWLLLLLRRRRWLVWRLRNWDVLWPGTVVRRRLLVRVRRRLLVWVMMGAWLHRGHPGMMGRHVHGHAGHWLVLVLGS